jgi:hypothetical protein
MGRLPIFLCALVLSCGRAPKGARLYRACQGVVKHACFTTPWACSAQKARVFIGLAVHALIYILLIFKFDLYRGACGGGSRQGVDIQIMKYDDNHAFLAWA